jgi:predicted GNAT family acetyltransferase
MTKGVLRLRYRFASGGSFALATPHASVRNSHSFPFVIPSAAEGPAVSYSWQQRSILRAFVSGQVKGHGFSRAVGAKAQPAALATGGKGSFLSG